MNLSHETTKIRSKLVILDLERKEKDPNMDCKGNQQTPEVAC